MEIGTFVNKIVSVLGTIISSIWMVLTFLFALPVVGFILQSAFAVLVIYVGYKVYWRLPGGTRRVLRTTVGSPLWIMSRSVRWPIGMWCTSDMPRPGETVVEKIVEKEVKVPMRRSFKQWFWGGVRWGLFYGLIAGAIVAWRYWP